MITTWQIEFNVFPRMCTFKQPIQKEQINFEAKDFQISEHLNCVDLLSKGTGIRCCFVGFDLHRNHMKKTQDKS